MREYKYRGLSKYGRCIDGIWLYGSLVYNERNGSAFIYVRHFAGDEDEYGSIKPYSVDIETIGQFTGLKDKNGVEIYEGDELQWEHGSTEQDTGCVNIVKSSGIVVFDEGGYFAVDSEDYSCTGRPFMSMIIDEFNGEVIGNIHKNHELPEIK